jgi:hypothetical protein
MKALRSVGSAGRSSDRLRPRRPPPPQDTTSLACDARSTAALPRLTAGDPVDVWASNQRVQGRSIRLGTDSSARPALLIQVSRGDSTLRTVPADGLQSLEVRVPNVRRDALYGAGFGASVGAAVTLFDVGMRFVKFAWLDPNRNMIDQRRAAAALALGMFGGSIAGAVLGTRIPRWEQRFARSWGRSIFSAPPTARRP